MNLDTTGKPAPVVSAAWPFVDYAQMMRRLERPLGSVDVVFDSDTYNEVDDQYALAYMIRSSEKLKLQALYAAPFFNNRSTSPADGMEKSYNEIKNILSLINKEDLYDRIYRGSEVYLPSEIEPVISDAAKDLAERAMKYNPEKPLYVIAIGAITNIASALLINPDIRDRIVIVWLGGNAFHWHDNREFNLYQDIAAARVVLGCGAAVILLPCKGVVSAFYVTQPELEYWLAGKNKLCDYLLKTTVDYGKSRSDYPTWSRAIWDVAAVAWLLDESFMLEHPEHSPIPEYDHIWGHNKTRHMIKYVYHINRERLFDDLFRKLVMPV